MAGKFAKKSGRFAAIGYLILVAISLLLSGSTGGLLLLLITAPWNIEIDTITSNYLGGWSFSVGLVLGGIINLTMIFFLGYGVGFFYEHFKQGQSK